MKVSQSASPKETHSKSRGVRQSFTSTAKYFMRKTWQIGDQIEGRWEVFNILQGGAGVVYIVFDHKFQESFAAKTFRDEIFARSPLIAARFEREAQAWVKLDIHPNIAEARMVEKIEGKPF